MVFARTMTLRKPSTRETRVPEARRALARPIPGPSGAAPLGSVIRTSHALPLPAASAEGAVEAHGEESGHEHPDPDRRGGAPAGLHVHRQPGRLPDRLTGAAHQADDDVGR